MHKTYASPSPHHPLKLWGKLLKTLFDPCSRQTGVYQDLPSSWYWFPYHGCHWLCRETQYVLMLTRLLYRSLSIVDGWITNITTVHIPVNNILVGAA